MFEEMMERIRFNITKIISFIEIKTEQNTQETPVRPNELRETKYLGMLDVPAVLEKNTSIVAEKFKLIYQKFFPNA